jgi:hypothetical protein
MLKAFAQYASDPEEKKTLELLAANTEEGKVDMTFHSFF